MEEKKYSRIIFIDLMRAWAVFMMLQGHTIDSFLSPQYKGADSALFGIWNFMRGFTAPIFMFSAGVAFTYLLKSRPEKFADNPRVKKGIKRFFTLILLAYFLRFPTYRIFDYSSVTPEQWAQFFVVDTLHLIAFGLLFVMIFTYLSEKFKIDHIKMLIAGAVMFVAGQILFEPINWQKFVHPLFAGYLYSGSGSFFPLFPWVAYVLAGGALGSLIASDPQKVRDPKFGIKLMIAAALIFASGKTLEQIKFFFNWGEPLWVNAIYWIALRIGVVLFLNGFMSFIAHRVENIPKVVKLFGRYSLVIYVVHIVALYGDAWFPGFNEFYYQKFGPGLTLVMAVVMIALMGGMVLSIDYIKYRFKNYKLMPKRQNLEIELSEK